MQYKPGNWVTGFKRSPRAANVQNRDMGLFLNSSGKFEPIDDSWDNLHSGGLFISDDNKLYFRDETNKDIYINSPVDNQITIGATSGVGINTTPAETFHVVDTTSEGGVLIDNTATDGNPILAFGLSGTKTFTMGVDDGDSDKFKIFSGTAIDGTSEFVIDGSGNVGIGTSSPDVRIGQKLDIATSDDFGGISLSTWSTVATDAPVLDFKHSKSNTIGTQAALADDDNVGYIVWRGSDGDEFVDMAVIRADVDGTPGDDDMPGRLTFWTTADGAASATERMRIDSAGDVGIGATPSDFTYANSLVIKQKANYDGMTIYTDTTTNTGAIYFADGTAGVEAYKGYIEYNHNDNSLRFGANANLRLLLASAGDVTVSIGNLVIGTAGKGIDFSAQTATATGTTTSELLDHYEEGTWVAAFTAGTSGSITILSSTVTGYYTRIGNLVTVKGRFEVDSVSSPIGELAITGLPFAAANPSGDAAAIIGGVYFEAAATAIDADIIGLVPDADTRIKIRSSGTTGVGNTLAANVDAGTNMLVSGTYTV